MSYENKRLPSIIKTLPLGPLKFNKRPGRLIDHSWYLYDSKNCVNCSLVPCGKGWRVETRQSDLLVLYRLSVVRKLTASSFWSTGAWKRELEANIFMVTSLNNNNQNICFIPLNCKVPAISLSSQVGLKRIVQLSKKQNEILFYL